jgi:TonB family protein
MEKTKLLFVLGAAFFLLKPISAQPVASPTVPLNVHQTVNASFPRSLVSVGVTSGAVSVAIAVDEAGRLSDYLVTAYTHPAFAENAVNALRQWTFEPMTVNGIPKASKADITFSFELEGVAVVSMTALESTELIAYRIAPGASAFFTRTAEQMKHFPSRMKVVPPNYSQSLARKSNGGRTVVDFYIDESGHVRLPSVSLDTAEHNDALAAIAIEAIGQWVFEPPVSNGRPVIVLAAQAFDFKPPAPHEKGEL